MVKLLLLGLAAGLAGAAYWYFKGSKSSDVYDYADSARDRAGDAFDSASKMASDAASGSDHGSTPGRAPAIVSGAQKVTPSWLGRYARGLVTPTTSKR